MRSLLAVILAALTSTAPAPASAGSWPVFGASPRRTNVSHAPAGITLGSLERRTISLPGTVDSAPISVDGTVVMTTTYGRTVALDGRTGRRLWTYTPDGIAGWEGSAQITNAAPAADPSHRAVYTASPDGVIHKLALADGHELWHRTITRLPSREKVTSALNVFGGYVLATTGGYVGDAPPYQGHVVTLARGTGRIHAVFNTLCANVRTIMDPRSCAASDSAIWGRAGAVVDARRREVLVASGNGPFDGRTNFGDSTLVLSFPDLRLKRHWTPYNQKQLEDEDKDLGSVSPLLLPGGLLLQGGKDGRLDLIRGTKSIQTLPLPGGAAVLVTGAPTVSGHTVFVASYAGMAAYRLRHARLHRRWTTSAPGTTPVVAGGRLYVYDPDGHLNVYRPKTGKRLASLPAGGGHWNSPIVIDGSIWLPEGDANDHSRTGTASLYR